MRTSTILLFITEGRSTMLTSRVLLTMGTLFAVAFSSASLPCQAQAADYPVVFTSPLPLRKLGIAIAFGEPVKPFNNKCYYYGDGGFLISISDDFLSRFLSKGFTVESTCLGLISETHYDPETGRRLATYMIVDPAAIKQRSDEPGAGTEELPLELPDCFKNANPYTDCVFNYGRKTGKKLSPEETETYRNLGAAIGPILDKAKPDPSTSEEFVGASEGGLAGYRQHAGSGLPYDGPQLDERLARYSSLSIWVRSSKLPRGYGYALDADGAAGPSLSAAAMDAAIGGLSKSQISTDDLKRALDARK
jgi:hypothetical protein